MPLASGLFAMALLGATLTGCYAQTGPCRKWRRSNYRNMPPTPQELGEIAAGVLSIGRRDFMIAAGEGDRSGEPWHTWIYDFTGKKWTIATQRLCVGHHHAPEVYKNRLYFLGGAAGCSGTMQIGEIFLKPNGDPDMRWRFGARVPIVTSSANTAVIRDKIYYCGGIAEGSWVRGVSDECAVYTPEENPDGSPGPGSWQMIRGLRFEQGRNHAASCTDGEKLYIFSGRNRRSWGFPDTFIYNPETDRWTFTRQGDSSSPAPIPVGRGGMGKAIYSRGRCFVFGGEALSRRQPANDDTFLNSDGSFYRVDIYDIATNSWLKGDPMPVGLHGLSAVTRSRNDCVAYIAFGGPELRNSQGNFMFRYRLATGRKSLVPAI